MLLYGQQGLDFNVLCSMYRYSDLNAIFDHLMMATVDGLDFPSQCLEFFYDFFAVHIYIDISI